MKLTEEQENMALTAFVVFIGAGATASLLMAIKNRQWGALLGGLIAGVILIAYDRTTE